MPKTIMNYENTLIYKICCKDFTITDIYVGHTTNFKQRKSCHKTSCNNESQRGYNFFVYKFIRENGGWDNWDMILIEPVSCNNKLEALQKERYYMELLNASLNSLVPSRTRKENYEQNKEHIKEYNKEYQKDNYEQNKEKMKEYKKEYYEQNKEQFKEYRKAYYEKNKM